MKRLLTTLLGLAILGTAAARLPERTPENVAKYARICREAIRKEMKGMYREAGGALRYPFLAPGSNQYLDMLWDWDSWLSDVALYVTAYLYLYYRWMLDFEEEK